MGSVKIPYYVIRQRPGRPAWGYWAPCLARPNPKTGKCEPTLMAKLGFKLVDCGQDGPGAWAIAAAWNERWKQARAKHVAGELHAVEPGKLERVYPPGSFGEGFARYRDLNTWKSKAPRTREDWWRGWKQIDPVFGDVDTRSVALEDLDAWYAALIDKASKAYVGVREAHRAMKIWRALFKVLTTLKRADGEFYCVGQDPSLGIRRQTPTARSAFWLYEEAQQLVQAAWDGVVVDGKLQVFQGLSVALAVAWDTTLSPVDVRTLTPSQRVETPQGPLFVQPRAKTGQRAIGTLTPATVARLDAYIAGLPFTLLPTTPIFHTRGGQPGPKGGRPRPPVPYTKDTLGDDFRVVREALFPGDTRTIMDFRRSGAIEVIAGEAGAEVLASKMANSIDSNRELQATYTPHTATMVRLADAARERGRQRLKAEGKGE